MIDTDLLIVGAGPFGLAMARYAEVHGIRCEIVGKPMAFWRRNMPDGMCLRSGIQWHLDPENELTLRRFLRVRGLVPEDLDPFPLDVYLDYASWFQRMSGARVRDTLVVWLSRATDGSFEADLADGTRVRARRVLLALGFHAFQHVPAELEALLPPGRFTHTRDFTDMKSMAARSVLIVGGRQSAFEWAALLAAAGAARVHVSHRHDTPSFERSEWQWARDLVDRFEEDPGWYQRLSETEQRELGGRFWREGRLKLEPWLAPRLAPHVVKLWPRTLVSACTESGDGRLEVTLDDDTSIEADHVILATGYQVDVTRLDFLAGSVRDALVLDDGFPVLNERFESSVPGLHFTSMAASRSFGPFLAFTMSVTTTTRVIGRAVQAV